MFFSLRLYVFLFNCYVNMYVQWCGFIVNFKSHLISLLKQIDRIALIPNRDCHDQCNCWTLIFKVTQQSQIIIMSASHAILSMLLTITLAQCHLRLVIKPTLANLGIDCVTSLAKTLFKFLIQKVLAYFMSWWLLKTGKVHLPFTQFSFRIYYL